MSYSCGLLDLILLLYITQKALSTTNLIQVLYIVNPQFQLPYWWQGYFLRPKLIQPGVATLLAAKGAYLALAVGAPLEIAAAIRFVQVRLIPRERLSVNQAVIKIIHKKPLHATKTISGKPRPVGD